MTKNTASVKVIYPNIQILNNSAECACYDFQGGESIATCASNVRNFEVFQLSGNTTVQAPIL